MIKGVDFVGIGICYFCHDGKGNFVMQKRGINARDEHGVWDIGAGALEVTDSVEQTLHKEIMEEYCTEVLAFEFLGYRDVFRTNESGYKNHWVMLDYRVLIKPENVKNGEPHKFEEVGWFTFKKLPSPVHSQLPIFWEKYKDRL